ncbi:ankyrin repeat-containing protein NPR4-like isoform X1 [Senna tora]|uniref:Ankyrin repeat-containing protein NPR4-like isoform X1 n=1 Tax=Senna tora TaxID=362788 RepID=A0A834TEG0_9FABA|nr:ankyrin repeat-containing protein NPR4-like isoform X1 [Senna tora]
MREIYELKLMHAQASQILRLVCKTVRKSKELSVFAEALIGAAKEGNVEFVVQVSKAHPEIVLIGDTSIPNIFYYAVQFRQARVFNLIHGLRFKDALTTNRDDSGNSLLHVVATLAPPSHLNSIYGAALQMQRELQWFKEVESVVPATIRVAQNNEGMTPIELFRESHKDLTKEGEKWIKETASSCSVVGALVVTIMFAAAFTVPGGNNQEFGYPIFIKKNYFTLFIFSTTLSLLSSSTSVLMFLGILTSRYSEEDFLKSLPTKLIIGLSALFISIATMIIAFLATIGLMLQHSGYSWGLLPVVILASVPVSLFVLLQFPLLFNTIFSTYAGIFNRKVKLWP